MCELCTGPCEWISLSTFLSPIPELQHAPLPLKVLWVRERVPTPPSSAIFHLDSHLSPSRSWECINNHLWLILRMFPTIINCFGHYCNYVVIIGNFILWVEWFLKLFLSMKSLICPIGHNNHQVSHTPRSIIGWLMGIFEFRKMAFEFKFDIWVLKIYI